MGWKTDTKIDFESTSLELHLFKGASELLSFLKQSFLKTQVQNNFVLK
jgi:hypothetical protein